VRKCGTYKVSSGRSTEGLVTDTVVVIGCRWRDEVDELSFVTRALAGAASRFRRVAVLVPGQPDRSYPDGAFDLVGIGEQGHFRWPRHIRADGPIIVDDVTPETIRLINTVGHGAEFYLCSGGDDSPLQCQRITFGATQTPFAVNMYVPINPLAEKHRHHGFGFTDYVLVLSGRRETDENPPPEAAWLTAAFHDRDVVVVENAVASAWRGRALRGAVSVDTRMDLWRLIAHAAVCIDLAPAPYIARECVESLRFGTAIIVPEQCGVATVHAAASGGFTFGDPDDMLRAVARMFDEKFRTNVSERAKRYAEKNYGRPSALVGSLHELLVGSEQVSITP
jgi:hypothetical protein